jgi:hypothetical protein
MMNYDILMDTLFVVKLIKSCVKYTANRTSNIINIIESFGITKYHAQYAHLLCNIIGVAKDQLINKLTDNVYIK